jgi:hypothetical protein
VGDPVLQADIDACVDRRFRRSGDAEIKRVAYGVLGERHSALLAVYRGMAACRTRGVSLLRRLFERDVLDELRSDSATTEDNVKCVLRGLRIISSDALIGEVLASGGIDSRVALKLLYPKLLRAAIACNAPKPRPPSQA